MRGLFTTKYLGNQIKEDEMGRASSTYRNDERCIQNFGWKSEVWRPLGRLKYVWGIIL
jgi:hypothetical protein